MDAQDDTPSDVSVFKVVASSAQDARLTAARNGVKRLRMVQIKFDMHFCLLVYPFTFPISLIIFSLEFRKI